jgi:glycosyltransferase involved in cell wall biosynthesis
MKILLCTHYYQSRAVGPAVFSEMMAKIPEQYPQHDLKIITDDAIESTPSVFKIKTYIPKYLYPIDFVFRNWAYYINIKKINKSYNADIVVFSNCEWGLLSRLLLPKRLILIGLLNHYYYLEKLPFKWKKRWFYFYMLRMIQNFAFNILDKIIVCSKDLKVRTEAQYPNHKAKISVLYQGIDMKHITFLPKIIDKSALVKILFLKSNIVRGGFDILCQAAAKLSEYDIEITQIGVVEGMEKERLRCMSFAPNVKFKHLGRLQQKAVYEALISHNILCTPSRQESLGIANIEGLAAGIAVVSVNEGGIPEVLDNGNNGWLAAPNDPISLAETLKMCIEATPSVFLSKKEHGRAFVEKHFDSCKLVSQFLEICKANTVQ